MRALLDTVFNLIQMCADIVDQHAQPTQRVWVGVRVLLTIPPPRPERYPDLDPGGLPLPVIIPTQRGRCTSGYAQKDVARVMGGRKRLNRHGVGNG